METFNLRGSGPAAYEQYLVPILFRPLAQRLLEMAEVGPDDRLLDVACGTGIVARLAVGNGVECTGVDLNPEMIATASKLAPQVNWLPCDAADLPLPDESYDVAVCQQGLQFMPDPVAALREMRRVLVPSGRVVVALWRDLAFAPGFAAFVDVLDRHLGAAAGDILRGPFVLGAAGPARDLLTAAGFAVPHVSIHVITARFGSVHQLFTEEVAATPLAEVVAELDEDRLRAMVDDLAEMLRERVDDDGVVFPIETHVFTAARTRG